MTFNFIDFIINIIFIFTVPVFFLVIGIVILNHKTVKINNYVGYRTPRSMRCARSWDRAQKMLGKYLLYDGIILIFVNIILLAVIFMLKSTVYYRILPAVLLLFQTASLFAVILKIENTLKKEDNRWDVK